MTKVRLRDLQDECHAISDNHGFHARDAEQLPQALETTDPLLSSLVMVEREVLQQAQDAQRLMLIVSELAEAMEHARDGNPDLFYVCSRCKQEMLTIPERHFVPGVMPPGGGVCQGDWKPDGFMAELADVVIRCCDLAGVKDADLFAVVLQKMAFNETRPHLHGKAY